MIHWKNFDKNINSKINSSISVNNDFIVILSDQNNLYLIDTIKYDIATNIDIPNLSCIS